VLRAQFQSPSKSTRAVLFSPECSLGTKARAPLRCQPRHNSNQPGIFCPTARFHRSPIRTRLSTALELPLVGVRALRMISVAGVGVGSRRAVLACYDPVGDGDALQERWKHHPRQYRPVEALADPDMPSGVRMVEAQARRKSSHASSGSSFLALRVRDVEESHGEFTSSGSTRIACCLLAT
jgi:hypothetical protein